MLEIHKKIVFDGNKKPIEEFKQLEDVIENYGLAKLMDEVKDDERLSSEDAKKTTNR